jgi:hypothetical protein
MIEINPAAGIKGLAFLFISEWDSHPAEIWRKYHCLMAFLLFRKLFESF